MTPLTLDLTLTVLSPVHIGSGHVLDPTEYVIQSERFSRLDLRRFADTLTAQQNTALRSAIRSGHLRDIWRVVHAAFDPQRHALYHAAVTPAIHKKYADGLAQGDTQLELHECIKEHGAYRPIIPGSSLKGAIRTAVLQALLPDQVKHPFVQDMADYWRKERQVKDKTIRFPATVDAREPALLEGHILKAMKYRNDRPQFDINQDPFRLLKIPDVTLPADCLEIVSVERIKHETGDAGGPPVLVEAIRPGVQADFSITCTPDFLMATNMSRAADLLPALHAYTAAGIVKDFDRCVVDVQQRVAALAQQRHLLRLGGHIGRLAFALDPHDLDLDLPEPQTICIAQTHDGPHLLGIVALKEKTPPR